MTLVCFVFAWFLTKIMSPTFLEELYILKLLTKRVAKMQLFYWQQHVVLESICGHLCGCCLVFFFW